MKWKCHDGGRWRSRRRLQANDCVIRAIAVATCQPYDLVYDQFADAGRKCGRSTPKLVWKDYLSPSRKLVFPAMKGEPRMSLARFAVSYAQGRYVAQCAGHLVAVINGFVYDECPPRAEACVYAAFECQ